MAGFNWIGFKNETGARQTELATILGTSQGTVSKRMSDMKIENSELAALVEHYGNDIVDKYRSTNIINDDSDIVMIPVINLDARGGFLSNEELGTEYTTKLMPFSRTMARDGDFVMPIYGDSMEPKYPSGCMVLIRKIDMWREYLELGATYVIELIDGRRVIKTIQKATSPESFILESINPKYEPTDIPKSMIKLVFRVIMSIQRETI